VASIPGLPERASGGRVQSVCVRIYRRRANYGEWRIEFMPGNTLSFRAPWEAGEYDA